MSRALLAEGRRRRLVVSAAVVVLVGAAVWVLLGSVRVALGSAVVALGALVLQRARRDDDAAKWRRGAVGEQRTARLLRPLERRGYIVLHDRALGRSSDTANIDHLVIGPTGVIVVDSKHWHKHTMVKTGRRGHVWVGRTRGSKVVAGLAVERRRVSQVLTAESGTEIQAYGVLAIHGAKLPYWGSP
jgi:hypothetical protein